MQATYLDINLSLSRAKSKAGIDVSDVDRDPDMRDLLEVSAGLAGEIKVFRPYFVAAKTLQQDIAKQQLTEADGVKFTGVLPVIQSLFNQQHALDTAMALVLPPGMESPVFVAEGQCGDCGTTARRRHYGSVSIPASFVF